MKIHKCGMLIKHECKMLKKRKIEGFTISWKNKESWILNFCFVAPEGCPYEGGKFNVEADLS